MHHNLESLNSNSLNQVNQSPSSQVEKLRFFMAGRKYRQLFFLTRKKNLWKKLCKKNNSKQKSCSNHKSFQYDRKLWFFYNSFNFPW